MIKTSTTKTADFYKIIRENGLCHYDGGFTTICPEDIGAISLTYVGEIPIAACIITKTHCMYGCNVGVFVAEKYRKQGIGTEILKKTHAAYPVELVHCQYFSDAIGFFGSYLGRQPELIP